MTKVQRTFKLLRELNDNELKKIAHIHAVYGFFGARLSAPDQLFIEYDASRLTPNEVEGTLEENGIPLAD
jgi:hypothetical protein